MLANAWLDGSYSEIYPEVSRDAEGMRRLSRQVSLPGGVPSRASPPPPGSIHEEGELGYSSAHATGAAFDNPGLTVACVIGDGEAETGALATSWHSHRFLHPQRDGVVLPVLHLNGYRIAAPTILGRMSDDDLCSMFSGLRWAPRVVSGDEPAQMHAAMAETLDDVLDAQAARRESGTSAHPPMVLLRTPKGWTGPAEVDGAPVAGTFRAHQVPLKDVATMPGIARNSSAGCEATIRLPFSRMAQSRARSVRSPPRRLDGSGRTRMPMAAGSCGRWICPIRRITR